MYEGFAGVYDHVMDEIPYDAWFQRLQAYLKKKGVTGGSMCELGCGTGTMTEKFANAGFQMIGVDLSEDMLALAKQKQIEHGTDILYLRQDMTELELAEPVDTILSVCDSMNYLMEEEALADTFRQVKKHLNPGGFFIFDLKTRFCYQSIMGNQTWVEQDEEVSYIWENYFYEEEEVNEYMLTIFRKQPETGLYVKSEEAHYQKAYRISVLQDLLENCGFTFVECLDGEMQGPPTETSERIYIIAQA